MLNSGTLTFREFVMGEPLPLATLQQEIFEFLRGRTDVVLYGAHAVNAYVDEPRMTPDVNLFSTRAMDFAEELKAHLNERFHIAMRLRKLEGDKGYRLFQVRKAGNRHLVHLRPVDELPPAKRLEKILVVEPVQLIALKVIAYHTRRGQPKSGTDWRDVAELLLKFPKLKKDQGPVAEALRSAGVNKDVLNTWSELVSKSIQRNE